MASLIELSDSDNDGVSFVSCGRGQGLFQETDEKLALRLQREEEAKRSILIHCASPMKAVDTSNDELLALRLQREEEGSELAQAGRRPLLNSPTGRKRPRAVHDGAVLLPSCPSAASWSGNDAQVPVTCTASTNITHELQSTCSDAVALIHRCFSQARDTSRSELLLCGPTPIFVQYRRKRRDSSSSIAAGIGAGVAGIAPQANMLPSDYWTCGYRNIQMLIGHLLQRQGSAGSLFSGSVPDVRSLQAELERLWSLGFDADGCQQLGGSVLDTQKWIGTSEACVLLRGQSVCANIIAFRGGGEPGGQDALSAASAVVEYASRHFRSGAQVHGQDSFGRGVVVSSRPPLYLQHDGHSRTVVGVQRRREVGGKCTDFLLVLDPGLGHQGFADFASCVDKGHGWERYIKRSLAPLQKKADYELLVVDPDAIIGPSQIAHSRCIQRHL